MHQSFPHWFDFKFLGFMHVGVQMHTVQVTCVELPGSLWLQILLTSLSLTSLLISGLPDIFLYFECD